MRSINYFPYYVFFYDAYTYSSHLGNVQGQSNFGITSQYPNSAQQQPHITKQRVQRNKKYRNKKERSRSSQKLDDSSSTSLPSTSKNPNILQSGMEGTTLKKLHY